MSPPRYECRAASAPDFLSSLTLTPDNAHRTRVRLETGARNTACLLLPREEVHDRVCGGAVRTAEAPPDGRLPAAPAAHRHGALLPFLRA